MSVALPSVIIPAEGVAASLGLASGQPYSHIELYNASAFTVQITGWSSGNFYLTPGQDRIATFKSSVGDPTVVGINNGSEIGTLYLTGYTINEVPIPIGTAGSVTSISGGTVNANITGGTVDANITNASIPVTGSLDANITNASIPVTGTVDANITNSTIDANITNASLAVTGSVTADISNASLAVTGNVDATLTGPVGISSGSTINVVNSAAGGQTPLSQTTTITNAPDTLDSTNYILAALPNANGLPAGSSGNLVYDSNLTNAIASVGPTWGAYDGAIIGGATIGTSNGDFTVTNPGTSQAAIEYIGTGSATGYTGLASQVIDVTPGATYTYACIANATNVTAGTPFLQIVNEAVSAGLAQVAIAAGSSGLVSGTYTPPSGTTQIRIFPNTQKCTVTAGQTISWSQIQLTQTSTVQPYEPGPLFNNILFKQDGSNFYYLGETTALALADTGQPLNTAIQASTSINSTVPQLAIPGAPTLSVEGTAGTTTATYGWVTQTSTAQGVVSLASNPGVNIGTIDIADGAAVQLAAGTAVIGTVNAQGSVGITNATLNIEGVSGGISVGTHVSSAPNNGSANTAIATGDTTVTGTTDIDIPPNTRSIFLAASMSTTESGTSFGLVVTGNQTQLQYYSQSIPNTTGETSVFKALFPVNTADTAIVLSYTEDFDSSGAPDTSGTLTIDYYVEFSGTIIPLESLSTAYNIASADSVAPADVITPYFSVVVNVNTPIMYGPGIVRMISWQGTSGTLWFSPSNITNATLFATTSTEGAQTVNLYVPPGAWLSVTSTVTSGQAGCTYTTL